MRVNFNETNTMKIKKLNLNILIVSSFVTKLDTKENETVAGGKLVKAIDLIGVNTANCTQRTNICGGCDTMECSRDCQSANCTTTMTLPPNC